MSDKDSSEIQDARRAAREALRVPWWTSAKHAGAVFAGTLTLAMTIAGVIVALNRFSAGVALGLALVAVSTLPVAFVVAELARLGRCKRALEEVLGQERLYEELLAEARQERDLAQSDRAVHQQFAAALTAGMAIEAFRHGPDEEVVPRRDAGGRKPR